MALYWDTDNVPDHERKLKEDPRMPECLMWAGFAIGLGEITEDNFQEWIYRLRRSAFEGRPLLMHPDGAPYEITEEMLSPWIGLRINVTSITNAEFDAIMRKRTNR